MPKKEKKENRSTLDRKDVTNDNNLAEDALDSLYSQDFILLLNIVDVLVETSASIEINLRNIHPPRSAMICTSTQIDDDDGRNRYIVLFAN